MRMDSSPLRGLAQSTPGIQGLPGFKLLREASFPDHQGPHRLTTNLGFPALLVQAHLQTVPALSPPSPAPQARQHLWTRTKYQGLPTREQLGG